MIELTSAAAGPAVGMLLISGTVYLLRYSSHRLKYESPHEKAP
jgi:hypothetical protein